MPEPGHIPVLLDAVLDLLDPQAGQTIVDCTLGRGGHAEHLAQRIAPGGRLIGLDVDPDNLEFARQRLDALELDVRIDLVHANFATVRGVLRDLNIDHADALLADLGFASNQMDDPQRGFSFSNEGPLDMRLDPRLPRSAAEMVNELPEKALADVIYQLGEDRLSRRIARKICENRLKSPINSTVALARIVRDAYGNQARRQRIDPATRTFMALRMAVNAELPSLERLLEDLPQVLAPSGAAAVISFHSLEDRRVKQTFAAMERDELGKRLTRKPIIADDTEIAANPRSRSAKLRGFRFARAHG